MNKTLATLALVIVPAVIVTACNGNSGGTGVSAIPNASGPAASQRGRTNPNAAVDLHAGGATFPAYGYNLGDQPVGTPGPGQPTPGPGSILAGFDKAYSAVTYYCLTGSGFADAEFEDNNGTATMPCAALTATHTGFGAPRDPLDFIGSDALASTACCAAGTTYYEGRLTGKVTWGQPFELPTFGGPIVFPYNKASFTGIASTANLQLSTWTYCAISNGTISNWNDPAITADNGGKSVTGGVNETLDYYFRSDSSGTSYLFTNKLNTACNQTWHAPYNKAPYQQAGKGRTAAWTFGVNTQWPGPGSASDPNSRFTGENGDPGVIAGIQADKYGTGYAEGAWAAAATIAQTSLLDTSNKVFVSPTNKTAVASALSNATTITYGGGSDGNPLGSTAPWCQLYINPSTFVTPPAKAYPIVGLSYWLFYGQNHSIHVTLKKDLVYYISGPTANSLLAPLEYTPLAKSVHTAIRNALAGSAGHKSCLQ